MNKLSKNYVNLPFKREFLKSSSKIYVQNFLYQEKKRKSDLIEIHNRPSYIKILNSKLKNKVTFGDYKLADIPNTCKSAIKAVSDLNFNYITIHISSGLDALKAAKKVSGKTKLTGVTILTSLNDKALKEIGFNKNVKKLVYQQAKLANKAKLDAIVCSAQEVGIVRKVFRKEIITPGIRFNSKFNDQKRVLTPKQAYKNGSDWLVIGRPITKGNIKKNIKKLIDHLNR